MVHVRPCNNEFIARFGDDGGNVKISSGDLLNDRHHFSRADIVYFKKLKCPIDRGDKIDEFAIVAHLNHYEYRRGIA